MKPESRLWIEQALFFQRLQKENAHVFPRPTDFTPIIQTITSLIKNYHDVKNTLQYTDPFLNWANGDFEQIQEKISFFFESLKTKISDLTSPHYIEDVAFILRFGNPIGRYTWFGKLSANLEYRLGDGPRYFDENTRQWGFVQKKGRHKYPQNLYIREIKS